jgi:hypothetical protein
MSNVLNGAIYLGSVMSPPKTEQYLAERALQVNFNVAN